MVIPERTIQAHRERATIFAHFGQYFLKESRTPTVPCYINWHKFFVRHIFIVWQFLPSAQFRYCSNSFLRHVCATGKVLSVPSFAQSVLFRDAFRFIAQRCSGNPAFAQSGKFFSTANPRQTRITASFLPIPAPLQKSGRWKAKFSQFHLNSTAQNFVLSIFVQKAKKLPDFK